MLRHALEKGVASLIAKMLLQTRHDAVFAAIARADALPPDEIEKLRAETLAHLQKVRDDGAPYADAVAVAVQEVFSAVAQFNPSVTAAASMARKFAGVALQHAADKAAAAGKATDDDVATGAATSSEASKAPIPDPPAGRAPVPEK